MSISYENLKRYISQWLKDTSNKELEDPFLESLINFILMDIYSATDVLKAEVSPTLTASKNTYTLAELGLSDSILRPLYLFIDGYRVPDYDYETLQAKGFIGSTSTVQDPDNLSGFAQNWELGYLKLYPTASTGVTGSEEVLLVYSKPPTELSSDGTTTFDTCFMPQWKEAIAWGCLYRVLAAASEKLQIEEGVRYNVNLAQSEYMKRLEEISFDAKYERTRVYTWKQRGRDRSVRDAARNFTY